MTRRCVLVACLILLAGCDKIQSAADTVTKPTDTVTKPSDGWTSATTESPVHGTTYVATFDKILNVEHSMREEIEVTCLAREKQFSVKFTLYGDKESDPDFQVTRNMLGTDVVIVDGSGITATNNKPHPVWGLGNTGMVAIGDYKNELVLTSNIIQDFPDELPIAIEVKSNQGTVDFEIPKSDLINGVVAHCIPDQPAASPSSPADASGDAAPAAPTPEPSPNTPPPVAASDASPDAAIPSAPPPAPTAADSTAGNPKFKDYPAPPLYTGPAALLSLDSDFARQYRTRLRDALNGAPVFAGEYVEAVWGCGSGGCHVDAFVNKRTGKVLEQTFGGEFGPFIDDADAMKINSRLIVAKGPIHDKDDNEVGYAAFFYVLDGDQMKLLKQVSIPKPPDEQP